MIEQLNCLEDWGILGKIIVISNHKHKLKPNLVLI